MSSHQSLIARSARWTRWLAIAILFVTVALQVAALFPDQTHLRLHRFGGGGISRMLALAHTIFMVLALVQLLLLLFEIERGALFSSGVTRRLRGFALFTLMAVAIGAFVAPLYAFLFPACEAGSPCLRRFPVDMRGLWSLIVGLVFFLVARLLDEARRIDEDNQQII